MAKRREKAFGPTLPERLVDALALDTADYQRFRWTSPPASRQVVYRRAPLSPTAGRSRAGSRRQVDDRSAFTVARYVLAGRPRPRIEDALRIGELMRLAALARFGWEQAPEGGRRRPLAPSVISGRDDEGRPLRAQAHSHAFWLPEDADGDGEIDHVTVYAADGFDRGVREKLDGITSLYLSGARDRAADASGGAEGAREEWRLALEGIGRPGDFAAASQILRESQVWTSVTPFLAAGYLKSGGYAAEVRRLLVRRGIVNAALAGAVSVEPLKTIHVHGRDRRTFDFHRFRSRSREPQPDPVGAFLKLTFPERIGGPLALGFGSHFGLGMFRTL